MQRNNGFILQKMQYNSYLRLFTPILFYYCPISYYCKRAILAFIPSMEKGKRKIISCISTCDMNNNPYLCNKNLQ